MKANELRIGLIGGTGEEGRGLALRFARAGAQVTIGSRSAERARTVAEELTGIWRLEIGHADNRAAVSASDLVVLSVPFEHAASTLEQHAADFQPGSILIDITVPVIFEKGAPRYMEMREGSGSEHLKARMPESIPLVAAFKTEPAHLLVNLNESLDCDVFVASDARDARAKVIEVISLIESARGVDAGPLYCARTLERMTVMAIGLNRRYKIKTARYRVVGL